MLSENKTFIQSIASYLINKHGNSLANCMVIFPNRRAGVFLIKELSQHISSPVFAPEIHTFDNLAVSITGIRQGDPLYLLFKLYKVYSQVMQSDKTFDDFIHRGQIMLSDFNEVDSELVDAKKIFTNIRDLKEIEKLFSDYDEILSGYIKDFWLMINDKAGSEYIKKFSEMWNKLYPIYNQFRSELISESVGYGGLIFSKAAELKKEYTQFIEDNKITEIIFAGFNALTRAEEEIFNGFKNTGKAKFFWDYDQFYIDSDEHEAGKFVKKNIKTFPMPDDFSKLLSFNNYSSKKSVNIVPCPHKNDQARVLSSILKNFSPENEKTVVLLPDETMLMPVLRAIPPNVNVNITMGFPLSQTMTWAFFESISTLYKNKITGKNNVYFKLIDLHRIVNHSFYASFNEEQEWVNNMALNNRNLIALNEVSVDSFLGIVCSFNGSMEDFPLFLSQLMYKAYKLLDNYKFEALKKIEQQAIFHFYTELRKISDTIIENNITFENIHTCISLIKKLCSGLSLAFKGEPLAGLQIMGLLETRTLDFENIILLSANEGKFPNTGGSLTFIPMNLRHGFSMKTPQYDDAIFTYYFYRNIQRAKNIWITYASGQNMNEKGEPSRFLLQLNYDGVHKPEYLKIDRKFEMNFENTITIVKDEAVMLFLNEFVEGKRKFSASSINSFIDCSLRFYFRYIAGLKEEQEISDDGPDAVFVGILFHNTIELLYNKHFTSNELMSAEKLNSIKSNDIDIAIEQAFKNSYGVNDFDFLWEKGANLLYKEILQKYIIAFINFEKSQCPFTYIGHEKEYFTDFIFDNKKVSFFGKIDRIDKKEGKWILTDYKLAKLNKIDFSIADLFDNNKDRRSYFFQLYFYLYMHFKTHGEALETRLLPVRNLFSDNKVINSFFYPDKENNLNDFEKLLINVLSDLFNKNINFNQTENRDLCKYCNYKGICER